MKRIYKFHITDVGKSKLEITGLIEIISVLNIDGEIVLYAFIDTDNKKIHKLDIFLARTGHVVTDELINWDYRGSFVSNLKPWSVGHFFIKVHHVEEIVVKKSDEELATILRQILNEFQELKILLRTAIR